MKIPAGQTIFKEGDKGDVMLILTEGEVEIREGSVLLENAGPGSIFGEMALIDDEPRSATVVATMRQPATPTQRASS